MRVAVSLMWTFSTTASAPCRWMNIHRPPFLTEPFCSFRGRHNPSLTWDSHSPSEALSVPSISRAIAGESCQDVIQWNMDTTCSAGGSPGEGGKSRQREFQISKNWAYNQQSSHLAKLGSGMNDNEPLGMTEENMIFTNNDGFEQKPAVNLFCPSMRRCLRFARINMISKKIMGEGRLGGSVR